MISPGHLSPMPMGPTLSDEELIKITNGILGTEGFYLFTGSKLRQELCQGACWCCSEEVAGGEGFLKTWSKLH